MLVMGRAICSAKQPARFTPTPLVCAQRCRQCRSIENPCGTFSVVQSRYLLPTTAESVLRITTCPENGSCRNIQSNALLSRSDVFVRTMTEKLLAYGTGRALKYYDMPVVRAIDRDAARNDNRFSSLIVGIVKSDPFQMKVKQQQETKQ